MRKNQGERGAGRAKRGHDLHHVEDRRHDPQEAIAAPGQDPQRDADGQRQDHRCQCQGKRLDRRVPEPEQAEGEEAQDDEQRRPPADEDETEGPRDHRDPDPAQRLEDELEDVDQDSDGLPDRAEHVDEGRAGQAVRVDRVADAVDRGEDRRVVVEGERPLTLEHEVQDRPHSEQERQLDALGRRHDDPRQGHADGGHPVASGPAIAVRIWARSTPTRRSPSITRIGLSVAAATCTASR